MESRTQQAFTAEASTISRGTIQETHADAVAVALPGGETRVCDALDTVAARAPLLVGDAVLVWLPPSESARGVILGRVGSPALPESAESDELVLDAKKQLVLQCGSGSITIREDGKILIKGKDLISHATRLNRIKGGAVQIN